MAAVNMGPIRERFCVVVLSALFVSEIFEILSQGNHFVIAECFMTGHICSYDAKFDDSGQGVRFT